MIQAVTNQNYPLRPDGSYKYNCGSMDRGYKQGITRCVFAIQVGVTTATASIRNPAFIWKSKQGKSSAKELLFNQLQKQIQQESRKKYL